MDEGMVQEILHELFSSFERMETQSSAILQFMKDKGIATDEELAPYLESAGNASGVRWLAARVRIDYLISGAMKAEEEKSEQAPPEASEKVQQSKPGEGTSSERNSGGHRDDAKHADATSKKDANANLNESHTRAGEPPSAKESQVQKAVNDNSPEESAA
jgi:hypothetical protein